jgi:uncharacterized membrane protein (UPF0182 family)
MRTRERVTRTRERAVSVQELDRLPKVALPQAPETRRLVGGAFVIAWIAVLYFLLDRGSRALMDLWFLDSIGLESVFWTNFKTGLALFGIGTVLFAAAIIAPAFTHALSRVARRRAIAVGALIGLLGGYGFAGTFRTYLLAINGTTFGETDPVFNYDIGFYLFKIPALWATLNLLFFLGLVAFISSAAYAYMTRPRRDLPQGMNRFVGFLGTISTPFTLGAFASLGVLLAASTWLSRYNVPIKDNLESNIAVGAEYVDVTGFFSSVNSYTVEMLAFLFMTLGVFFTLRALRHSVVTGEAGWRRRLSASALLLVFLPGFGLDLAFRSFVALRDEVKVTPNEPNINLPYIQRHVDATNKAYGTDNVEIKSFTPKGPDDPPADIDRLLASPTVRNVPLWPGYTSYLENQLDVQHRERITLTQGDTKVYGPTLDAFMQQEKLRPYYGFEDVDTVRYNINGEPRLFASAIRETPLDDPQPWLYLWGQRSLLFTRGHGIVMTPVAEATSDGSPNYATRGIPNRSRFPELEQPNPSIIYGEAANTTVAFSNAKNIKELDRPTDEGRAEVAETGGPDSGVRMDSLLKRAVIGWRTGSLLDLVFTNLIDDETRVHYFRKPVDRLEHIAPFLWYDTDPYAVVGAGNNTWMVNGMTWADRYPYAMWGDLGDKADVRTTKPRPFIKVNYVQDSVKATIDTFTGGVNLYKWKDEPVANAWQQVYPDLFKAKTTMPPKLQEQVQYPPQLFHVQFDDLYVFYHQKEALTYFNQEDMWDDGDEVKGPIIDEGEALTFSMEPYYWIAPTGGDLPASGKPTQFSMSMIFTPENALNVRSIVTAYMEGNDYGKLTALQIPKGAYSPGPEQADAAIDQDPFISQQIALWSRQGLSVIRGHTTPLVVEGELLYIEPLFIQSEQNPFPQLKRVAVVYRGHAALGETLPEALRAAVTPEPKFPVRPGPELGGEPGFVSPTGTGTPQEGEREGGFTTTAPRNPDQQPTNSGVNP